MLRQNALVTAAVTLPVEEREWVKRGYDANTDDGLYYLLSVSYTRSRSGFYAGASRAGRSMANRVPCAPDEVHKQVAFMEAHRPVWEWLLENADVTLAIDPKAPADSQVWGWMITSGPNVIHALGVKRTVVSVSRDLAQEIALDLAGDRWDTFQSVTLELPQFQRETPKFRGADLLGITKPSRWTYDTTWLLTRMVGRS